MVMSVEGGDGVLLVSVSRIDRADLRIALSRVLLLILLQRTCKFWQAPSRKARARNSAPLAPIMLESRLKVLSSGQAPAAKALCVDV